MYQQYSVSVLIHLASSMDATTGLYSCMHLTIPMTNAIFWQIILQILHLLIQYTKSCRETMHIQWETSQAIVLTSEVVQHVADVEQHASRHYPNGTSLCFTVAKMAAEQIE